MKFDIITLFPDMFKSVFSESIIFRAKKEGLIDINLHQLRNYATDKHKSVDDTPCGGGPGMVLKVDVIDKAITTIKHNIAEHWPQQKRTQTLSKYPIEKKILRNKANMSIKQKVILLTPKGEKFTQKKAIELSKYDNLILVCGHYEGFDQRIHDHLVDEEVSIGDYVLTGGEVPAMVLVDAITRMVPGVIKEESIRLESFMPQNEKAPTSSNHNNLPPTNHDFPNYTRPIEYKGWRVPKVLLSGNHKKIDEWRKKQK